MNWSIFDKGNEKLLEEVKKINNWSDNDVEKLKQDFHENDKILKKMLDT